jgi:hypothetical protein
MVYKKMKRALLVGIDDYDHVKGLRGCVNDVNALHPLLAKNEDGSPNFACEVRTSDVDPVDRRSLLEDLDALLAPGADIALFYFSGHGARVVNDAALITRDADSGDSGISLSAILGKVQNSPVREVFIILDCCFGGGAGGVPQIGGEGVMIRQGVSILSASRGDQPAVEAGGRGLFSTYLCGALDAGAADVLGKVTVSDVYAYLSEAFGPWDQRPTFKANVDRLHVLRGCSPAVPLAQLRKLPEIFPDEDFELPLDPSFEPTANPKHDENEATFAFLQQCRAAKLVEPVGADHLYFAAMDSLGCKLTPLGKLYWSMAKDGRI